MKLLFNFVSLLVLIAYCLYNDGVKINQAAKLKSAIEKVVIVGSSEIGKQNR